MKNTTYPPSIGCSNSNCGNVTDSNNSITNHAGNISIKNINNVKQVIVDENQEIMRWLSPLDPTRRHHDVRTDRCDGVGNWLLETREFREWMSNDGVDRPVLFCCGNLGAGKTYLSSLVIDNLCDEADEEGIATAMFYCDFRHQQKQTATNIMGAILKQLVVREEVLGHVRRVFEKAKREVGGRGLLLSNMEQILKQVIAKLPRVFICIDAIDECLPKHLLDLLVSLKKILQEKPSTRVFVTGRPQTKVEITRHFTTAVIVPISPNTGEVEKYLERKLEKDTRRDAMRDDLRDEILRTIPATISEIFPLVSLNIDAILGEITLAGRRKKLKEMTKDKYLEDVYGPTLARIQAQDKISRRLGMEALMWVSKSERPLHISELRHALGVKIGSADLDEESIPTIETLLTCSLGLITVEESSSTAQFSHPTLQKYLSNHPSLFENPHLMIAEVCLTCLNFRCVREPPSILSSIPPLVAYASCYWGVHIKRGKTKGVSPLARQLLTGFENHISSQLLSQHSHNPKHSWEPGSDRRGGHNGFTGLHGAAFLGIVEMVAELLPRTGNINATDAIGRTALALAIAGGHEDVVMMLLQRGDIDPGLAVTELGQTVLIWAAEGGREWAVKLLLEQESTCIDPNTIDARSGRTALSLATSGADEGVIKLLLKREDIDPNIPDAQSGRTPLWWAARGGNERVLKLLLKRKDINLNTADTRYNLTPLSVAEKEGNDRIVKLLSERANTNHPSPEPPGAVQSPRHPTQSASLAPPDPHPPVPNPSSE